MPHFNEVNYQNFMTEIQEDNTLEMEGELQTPDARQKVFNSTRELGEWLVKTNPIICQVQPTNDGKHVLTWRSRV